MSTHDDDLTLVRTQRGKVVILYYIAAIPITIANSIGSLWVAWRALAAAALVPPASLALCAAFVVARAWVTYKSADLTRKPLDLAKDDDWQTTAKSLLIRPIEAVLLDAWLIGGAYLIAWCAS